MKTYTMHVQNGDETFHVSFASDAQNHGRASQAFSACCSAMVWGFGDAKSYKLGKALESADKTGKGEMEFKHQGTHIKIKVVVE